jgi:hypothetical protein
VSADCFNEFVEFVVIPPVPIDLLENKTVDENGYIVVE